MVGDKAFDGRWKGIFIEFKWMDVFNGSLNGSSLMEGEKAFLSSLDEWIYSMEVAIEGI